MSIVTGSPPSAEFTSPRIRAVIGTDLPVPELLVHLVISRILEQVQFSFLKINILLCTQTFTLLEASETKNASHTDTFIKIKQNKSCRLSI